VSKHLKILRDAGLVTAHRDGLWVNYRIGQGDTCPYSPTLLESLEHWLDEDPRVIEIFERLPTVQREDEVLNRNINPLWASGR
jgi:ArsR family transcriptional regulator